MPGEYASSTAGLMTFLLAGLVLSLINALLRPIIVILSLPAILLTLGLFMLIVNGVMVYLTFAIVPQLSMGFWKSVVAGMIVWLANYVLSSIIEIYISRKEMRVQP